MNPILQHMAQRRSVKPIEMIGPGPDAEQLSQILNLAARVPDHGKLTPWRFIVLEGEARARAGNALAQIWSSRHVPIDELRQRFETERFLTSPMTVIVVSTATAHVKIPIWEQELSAGAVCMALTLAATGSGFKTAWLTDWCAYDTDAKAALGIAESEKVAGFIHIGRFDAPVADRPRPDLDRIVTRF